jgi:AhpD family alkylhydroperoxidase
MNWNQKIEQVMAGAQELAQHSPDTLRGVGLLAAAGAKTNRLDARTRELIALAVAVTTRCDGCIAVHAAEAIKLGISKEEMSEALGVAVNLNAGAAVVYSTHVPDAMTQLKPAEPA